MRKNSPFIIALIAGGCATFYYVYKKTQNFKYEKSLFLQRKYSEYLKITQNNICSLNVEMFVYASFFIKEYSLCLEKTKNYFTFLDINTILFVSKYRLLAGIQLFRYNEVFGNLILLNTFSIQKFFKEENEIFNEIKLNFQVKIEQPDFYLLDDLLETFPLLFKEFKSHINSQHLISKKYYDLILEGQSSAFRFLKSIFAYLIDYTDTFTDEKYFYTIIFKEYLKSKFEILEPSFFDKENVSSCFYKSLIYKNCNNKSKYLFWLSRAMNYEENCFVYKYVINEMVVIDILNAYELCKKVININFKYFLPVIFKISTKLKNRDSEYYLKSLDRNAMFYLYSAINSNNNHILLRKAFELQPNSFIILYNYGLSLLLIYDLSSIFYFKKCTTIKFKELVNVNEIVIYLEEVNNIVKYRPELKVGLVDYVIRTLGIKFIE